MRSITFKLTLAFLIVSLAGIGLVALLVWGITSTEFNRFLIDRGMSDYATAVTTYYKIHGSWQGVEEALLQQGLAALPVQSGGGKGQSAGSKGPPPFVLVDAKGVVLVSAGPFSHPGDTLDVTANSQNVPITVNNQVVGYVLRTGGPPRPDPFETRYQARTNQALILATLGAMILSVLLGLILARTITRPVRDLTVAISAMAGGKLNQQVQVRSKDELGELTRSFNQMSTDLERSNGLRRQMTADIAHDLRTPLAVITGYLEGLKDGVVKPSPARFKAMHDEALFLQRLVEDLRTLSLADSGELSINPMPTPPGDFIERLANSYQHQAEQNQIHLKTVLDPGLGLIQIDPERMQQALGNVISNALRYTPADGEIILSARQAGDEVLLEVKDSGAGIAPDVLAHIFERSYRGDDSRQESGSGLGLAIAKSIVELQGGKITAASDGLGSGSAFTISMPCSV